jgi:MFS family permease
MRLLSTPGARRLLTISIIARLPLTMFSIALLLQAQHLTSSFAAGGLVTGVYALSLGIGGPLLGQLADRRGQPLVLATSASVSAVLLLTIALLPVGASLGLIVVLATGTGLATPPLGACVRTLFGAILPDRAAVQAAYALDASAEELTWISGPPLALGIGVLWSTGAAVAFGGGVLLLGTVMFAAQPASRDWTPDEVVARRLGGSMRAPAMRTLVIVLIGVGVLFGAVEVAITGAAESAGTRGLAAPLIALWGAGSLAGGLVLARHPSRTNSSRDLVLLLAALTLGHGSLAAATGSIYALGALLFVAGAAIAPTFTTVYAILDRVTPAGTMTEAFAWLETATAVGGAIGAAVAGSLADAAGPGAVFAFAGGAGGLALLTTVIRMRTLRPGGASPSVGPLSAVGKLA